MASKSYNLSILLSIARGKIPQKRAAEACGLSQSVLSKIESGKREPTAVELKRLADFYNKSLSFFFPERDKRPTYIDADQIAHLIERYGYPLLVHRKRPTMDLKLRCEEVIVSTLGYLSDPRLIEAVPTLFYLNDIDYELLHDLSWRNHIQNRLGFIVDITIECYKSVKLKRGADNLVEFSKKIEQVKLAKEDSFTENIDKLSGQTLKYLRDTRDPIAVKWNLLDRFSADSFKEAFKRAILAKAA